MGERPPFDLGLALMWAAGLIVAGLGLAAVFWLFFSVVIFGGGTSCPQNLC